MIQSRKPHGDCCVFTTLRRRTMRRLRPLPRTSITSPLVTSVHWPLPVSFQVLRVIIQTSPLLV